MVTDYAAGAFMCTFGGFTVWLPTVVDRANNNEEFSVKGEAQGRVTTDSLPYGAQAFFSQHDALFFAVELRDAGERAGLQLNRVIRNWQCQTRPSP